MQSSFLTVKRDKMNKVSVFLMMSLMALMVGAAPSYAHEGKGRHPSPKHAIRELNEAKEILGKLTPDADGHIAKGFDLRI